MASLLLSPGGDEDFGITFWSATTGTPATATDFVHGSHVKSLKFRPGQPDTVVKSGLLAATGGRISIYVYLNAKPSGSISVPISLTQSNGTTSIAAVNITSAGVLQLVNDTATQLGSNGSTLATGTWYRITLACSITSTSVNSFKIFLNGTVDITVTNGTLHNISPAGYSLGQNNTDTAMDLRMSDIYADNNTSVTDIASDVWVTAKEPISNGTTNGMTGSGTPSGLGTGNARYVNERPVSTSNFVSVIAAGSAITEEYNLQTVAQGDIDITGATIIDYMGWVINKALIAETGSIIVNGVSSNISITTGTSLFFKAAGSTTYPAGTGTDIGMITATTVTTVSLYECGIMVAYTPAVAATTPRFRSLLGVGL